MVGVAIVFLCLGFAAGLTLFKVKSRWCPRCGDNTVPLPGSALTDPAYQRTGQTA